MRDSIRLYATLVVWFFFAALTTALFTISSSAFVDASPGIALAVLITLAITTIFSTLGIWDQLNDSEDALEKAPFAAKKPKRVPTNERRLARLVDTLDDDDIDALEALIAERDAEAQRSARH
jgi:uncharacterized membrane protein YccC